MPSWVQCVELEPFSTDPLSHANVTVSSNPKVVFWEDRCRFSSTPGGISHVTAAETKWNNDEEKKKILHISFIFSLYFPFPFSFGDPVTNVIGGPIVVFNFVSFLWVFMSYAHVVQRLRLSCLTLSQPGGGGGGGGHIVPPPPPGTLPQISQERLELQTWNFLTI